MNFHKYIERAVKRQVSLDQNRDISKREEFDKDVKQRVASIIYQYDKGNCDFSKYNEVVVSKDRKVRFVKEYSDKYSTEHILCQCVKYILDLVFKIKYPNRNELIRALFDTIKAIEDMSDFTIVKYDFKDYFNSVSTEYVFEKYMRQKFKNREDIDLINKFTNECKYAYAGLSTSNIIAEIIAQHFDKAVRVAFAQKGILFFERYIDDSIIIFNQHIEEDEIDTVLKDTLEKIYHDQSIKSIKCKTKLNEKKSAYISLRPSKTKSNNFDYLGYDFQMTKSNGKVKFKYGITKTKQEKYTKHIKNLIKICYGNEKDGKRVSCQGIELLRHRIRAFTSRIVYVGSKFKTPIWKTKGLINNYGQLRFLLENDDIDDETVEFLKNMVINAFNELEIEPPYFLKRDVDICSYSLFESMKKNRTLIFDQRIGFSKKALEKMCGKVGLKTHNKNGKPRGYGALVRDYLIEMKVGY